MTFSKETKHESADSKHAGTEFQSFALAAQLLQNVAELGYTQATPVQAQVIPAALAGGDLLVSSQTGSGKTAAFLLPLINQLIADNPSNSPAPVQGVLQTAWALRGRCSPLNQRQVQCQAALKGPRCRDRSMRQAR